MRTSPRPWPWLALCLLALALDSHFRDASAQSSSNTVVHFDIQRGTSPFGAFDVELFDQDKPETVRNFLLYVRSGAYSNAFLHRCLPNFVVQGGGFAVTNPLSGSAFASYLEITNYGRLKNEFTTGQQFSNTFGTIAMAKVGDDPNSATSQWFFNLASNTNLDTQNGGFTVFGRILSNTNASNVLAHFNTLSKSTNIANLGSGYPSFGDLPFLSTNATSRTPLYRELYYFRVSMLNETNAPGVTPPTIQLVAPPPNSTFTNQAVTISGTATDDTGVARVVYRLQGGAAEGAFGTTNWQFTVSPQLGLNSVSVESIDWDGNRSAAAAVTFLYLAQVPLNLQVAGMGKVLGAANGQLLQIGSYRTLTAVPGTGYMFLGWSGSVTSSLATITFLVQTNFTNVNLTAKFIRQPLPRLAGMYKGLFLSTAAPASADSGCIAMKVETDGKIGGQIYHRGGTYAFNGKFDAKGQAVLQGDVGGIHRTLTLELQATNAAGLILGSMGGTSDVRLERLSSTVLVPNGVSMGRYTFGISPPLSAANQLTPGGYGYGTGTIDSLGRLALSGRLGDGQTFSGSAPMSLLHRWPVYVDLFGGRGVLLGWVAAGANGSGNLDGTLHWIKGFKVADATYPGGFSNQVVFVGSRFPQTVPGDRIVDWVHGFSVIKGDFQVGISNLCKLTPQNTLTALDANTAGVSWVIDPVTGLVTGSFVDQWTGTSRVLRGVVVKRTQSMIGQFMDRRTAGRFELGKSPFLVTQSVDSVTFDAALNEGGYLQFTTNTSITFTQPFDMRYDTTLDANGYTVVISGGESTRLFGVLTNRIFTAKGVTFADGINLGSPGAASSPPQPGGESRGAGFMNQGGIVALTNCVLTNFFVQGGIGGKNKSAGIVAPGGRGCGAAIFTSGGRLILSSCLLADNVAQGGPGNADPISDLLSAQRGAGLGGAVFSESGECQIESTAFFRNRAAGGPGRTETLSTNRAGDGFGGALAISGGRLQVSLSEFRDNHALSPDSSTNNQAPAGGHGGAILIDTNAVAIIDQSTLIDNDAVAGVSFGGQYSGISRGGAILNGGTLHLRKSTVEQNTAAFGGGIASAGALALDASTMSSNVASAASGGAVFCYGGSLAATNSTFAFNTATNAQSPELHGGGLLLTSNSAVMLNNTIAFNQGAGIELSNSSLRLRNSLLASNVPQNVVGSLVDEGYNFSSDGSALLLATGSTNSIDPRLGLFATNGGPTRTFALLPASPARDVVPTNSAPSFDQRGTRRPQGINTDIGAFEFSPAEAPPAFTIYPIGGTVRAGTNFAFQTVVTGAQPITYLWLLEDSPISIGTNSIFTVSNVLTSANYRVIATNRFGSATSIVAKLTVDAHLVVTGHPSDVPIAPGGSATFSVAVAGPPDGFIWYRDGVPIPGANAATLTVTNAGLGTVGTYRAVVTNYVGSVTSQVATLTLTVPQLSLRLEGTNALITCAGPPGRTNELLKASSLSQTQSWTVVTSSVPAGVGTSLWVRPLLTPQDAFFRVRLPQ